MRRRSWLRSVHGAGASEGVVYTVSEIAARHGVSVERETTSSAEAYKKAHAGLPRSRWVEYQPGLLPKSL